MENAQKKDSENPRCEKDAKCQLLMAKLRFVKAVNEYKPLSSIVRRNPFTSLALSLLAGIAVGNVKKNVAVAALAQPALQLGILVARYVLGLKK